MTDAQRSFGVVQRVGGDVEVVAMKPVDAAAATVAPGHGGAT